MIGGVKMIKRKLGKYGNTDVIKLKSSDKEHLNLEYGDEVDISKLKKIKEEKDK